VPGLVFDTSLSGTRVARELDRLVIERGKPEMVVSDNGSEFTILTWADQISDIEVAGVTDRGRHLRCKRSALRLS
jgi:transposase InsO family protein